ncbi:MAG: hypothetical protein J0J01_13555 [Reyranella sp.]|uniref:hypothetical protein n=1 Tax=Reyranella sp. TaxID=1929291 RepID=UPI001ACC5B85|nr:hypothetical protein [Reyranella sp.]MBN9087932.1 hypothetical protein [Reyranella sp.]
MRLSSLLGAALGTGLLVLTLSSGANAWDGYRDHDRDHDHWRYDHHRYEHEYWRHERPVVVREVVRERPVVVQRAPVYMAPQPMYVQPMPYNQGPSGLNLNFNIPLN